MDLIVDATAQAWMRQGLAETTPEQDDLLRELHGTKPEPDVFAVWSLNLLSRLIRLFQARYLGTDVVRTSDSRAIYGDLRLRLLRCLALAELPQEHDLARRAFPEQLTDLDQGGLEQRGDDRQRLIDWVCDHCQRRGLMRYREALTGFFAETDRRIDEIHCETWLANFPDRQYVPLPPLGESMAQYRERIRQEIEGNHALREEWERLAEEWKQLVPGSRPLDPEVGEFANYSVRQIRIGAARVRLRRLAALVMTKVQYQHLCEHPVEREIYIQTRQQLLDDLQAAGLEDGLDWATEAIPERLAEVITGDQTWDYDGVIRLDDELYRLVANEKLTRLVELLTTHIFAHDGTDAIIREIDQATRRNCELEELRVLATAEWHREHEDAQPDSKDAPGQEAERAQGELLSPAGQLSADTESSVVTEPVKKKRKSRVEVDTKLAQLMCWILYENPRLPETKERWPSIAEVRDAMLKVNHPYVSVKSLRTHMAADSEVGSRPPRPPYSEREDELICKLFEEDVEDTEDNA